MFRRLGKDSTVAIATQFITAMTWTYVYVFLPFYIESVSPYDRETTLVWIGVILGISGVTSALTAPLWGGMAARWPPKLLFSVGIALQGAMIAGLALTRDLPAIFALRFLVGTIGGLSTIGMVVISATAPPGTLTGTMAIFQSAITLGHITGPLIGALTAELVGFRGAFLSAGAVMIIAFCLCRWGMGESPPFAPPPGTQEIRGRRLAAAWMLCFAANTQIAFMPGVLPEIVKSLGVAPGGAIKAAGFIVFSYGLASITGSYALGRLAQRWGDRRVLPIASLGGSILLPFLALPGGILAFGAIRFLQVGLIAGTIPIIFAQVASASSGRTIGVINTSRFVGFAVGPFLASWFFAHGTPLRLYLTLSAMTVAALPALQGAGRAGRHAPGGRGAA